MVQYDALRTRLTQRRGCSGELVVSILPTSAHRTLSNAALIDGVPNGRAVVARCDSETFLNGLKPRLETYWVRTNRFRHYDPAKTAIARRCAGRGIPEDQRDQARRFGSLGLRSARTRIRQRCLRSSGRNERCMTATGIWWLPQPVQGRPCWRPLIIDTSTAKAGRNAGHASFLSPIAAKSSSRRDGHSGSPDGSDFGELYVSGRRPDRWEHVFASVQSLHSYDVQKIPWRSL